ncbi:MAG: alpha/beta hydrolase [Solirubrobacterales bacterium]
MALDAETEGFLEKSRAKGGATPGEMSLADFRAAVEPFRDLGFEREDVDRVDDLRVPRDGGEEVAVRLYRSAGQRPLPLIVWAHGGSWVRVTVDLLDNHYRVMANRSGCAIAAVDYRLSPESRFPQAIEEVYGAARWLRQEAKVLGLDPTRIAIAGESSGGNLAAAVGLLDRDRRLVGFAFEALIIPVLDARFGSRSWEELGSDYLLTKAQLEWALERYAPDADRDDPLLSPLRAESLAGLPPTLVVTGEFDPLKDEGQAYAKALAEAGVAVEHVEVPGMIHHAVMAPKVMSVGRQMVIDSAERIGAALRGDGR